MVREYSRIFGGVCALCSVLFWTGCSAGENEEDSVRGNGFLENEGVTISVEAGSDGDKTADNGPAAELTSEEIKQFTDFVNRTENNGFLMSQYDDVAGADLNEIFYNGAGMETEPLTEEERRAYEAAASPIETDITKLSAEQIEEFLQRKTGVGLKDMTGELDWIYLEDTDCYVSQHGDTNYCAFVCTGGTRRGDTYEIRLKAGEDYVSDCVVTLKKNGDDYRFISNRYFENTDDADPNRQMEDQSPAPESGALGESRGEAPDLSGLDADIMRQLEVFAEAKEQWIPEDYDPFIFGYTVYDLDGDGSLELVVQVMAGTGLFSENHFYRTNDSRDGIEELPQEYYYGTSELDIGVSGEGAQAFRDADGTVYYMASDNTRNGYAESSHNDGAYFLKDGRVHSVVYRGLYREAQGEDSWKETYYDAADNEISAGEWEALLEEFRAGKEEVPCNISWINAYPEDVEKASVQEVLGRLSECLQ